MNLIVLFQTVNLCIFNSVLDKDFRRRYHVDRMSSEDGGSDTDSLIRLQSPPAERADVTRPPGTPPHYATPSPDKKMWGGPMMPTPLLALPTLNFSVTQETAF